MKRILINKIKIHNFKGFLDLCIDFSSDATILGGMNGFGKTTIFDAIELLFTSKIKRLESYSRDLVNHVYRRSQENLPLVHDMTVDSVSITAEILINDEKIIIKREAAVRNMKNPVDFTPFEKLYYYNTDSKAFELINQEIYNHFDLFELAQNYDFLNYLSQEEATAFLKYKDADRASFIQNLFDTSDFDNSLDKIDRLQKIVKEKLEKDNNKLKSIMIDIRDIENGISNQYHDEKYVSLTANKEKWDEENPDLSYEEFNGVLGEGGILDNLVYYLDNKDLFKQIMINRNIERLLEVNILDEVVSYLNILSLENEITNFERLSALIISPLLELKSNNVASVNWNQVKTEFLTAIPNTNIDSVFDEITIFINEQQAAGNIQKLVVSLLESRDVLSQQVVNCSDDLSLNRCPLCGNDYGNSSNLNASITAYKVELENSFKTLGNSLKDRFDILKSHIINTIVIPIQQKYADKGIDNRMLLAYKKINKRRALSNIDILKKLNLAINVEPDDDLNLIVQKLRTKLDEKYVKIDDSCINLELMNRISISLIKKVNTEMYTKENIELKRQYLIAKWNQVSSALLIKKHSEEHILEHRIKVLTDKKQSLKKLTNERKHHRNVYITAIISDIQILFYIYSGRILQESPFGRGIFIKPDLQRNRILFVNSNYSENDVDVLYNMSSGQLVAVSIAFLLSLNKLYSSFNLLAIDDPIQSIDDINMWGLMETIRHDFKNNFILLSTHESNYGQFLDYKFRKIGIKSQYLDMSTIQN